MFQSYPRWWLPRAIVAMLATGVIVGTAAAQNADGENQDVTPEGNESAATEPGLPPNASAPLPHGPDSPPTLKPRNAAGPQPIPSGPATAPLATGFPYTISGVFADAQGLTLIVGKQKEHFLLRLGEILEDTYRLEGIDSQQITLTNLPLGTSIRVPFESIITAGMSPISSPLLPARAVQPAAISGRTQQLNSAPAAERRSQTARVRLEGPAEVGLGSEFTIALKISSRNPVGAWPLQVGFDPAVMELVAVQPGAAVAQADSRHFSYTVMEKGSIAISAINPVAVPLVDAEVVELTFRPMQQGGTTEVWIAALRLEDGAGRALAHATVDPVRMTVTH